MPIANSNVQLHRLARLYDVQSAYENAFGEYVESPAEAVLSVLKILGAPAHTMSDLPEALRKRRGELWERCIDPVLIAWDGHAPKFTLRLPAELAESDLTYHVILENGDALEGRCQEDLHGSIREVDGQRYFKRRLRLVDKVPPGYHRLEVRSGRLTCTTHLISSFVQTYVPEGKKPWGVFCPLYALGSARNWGAGDFSDLAAMIDFATQMSGQLVGTLPLLPAFLDEPFNPSPYAPISRRFWNEFYLDVARIPELESCPDAREVIESADFQSELKALRVARLIDYRRAMAIKRSVLEKLLDCLLRQNAQRREGFENFVEEHRTVQDYAAFRAKVERERKVWELWAAPSRDGLLAADDYDQSAARYHLYVQWQCREQMQWLAEKSRSAETRLYLDFPLGVNRDGYDVWRERSVFALEASGGAPPDGFFSKGQDWGFPPLHPEGLRQQGYRHYIEVLRHHMGAAGMLRVDHVLGLHRLYWVPAGFAADQGVYVRYRAEEFYAVLSLESHRHQVQIIGENLGTVPAYVNTAMARHNVFGMRVGQFSVRPDPQNALEEIPPKTVVSLNTHDTPTFMGFWQGGDIQDRIDLGLLSAAQGAAEQHYRAAQREALIGFLRQSGCLAQEADPTEKEVLKAWLSYLASSEVDLLLVNLEDLWLEPAPQNVPGTWEERPNWRRKSGLNAEDIGRDPAVADILNAVKRLRAGSSE